MPRPRNKKTRRTLRERMRDAVTPFRKLTATLAPLRGDADDAISPSSEGGGPAVKQLPARLTGKGDGTPVNPRMVDSERSPADEGGVAPLLDLRQQEIVNLVEDRFLRSWWNRMLHDEEYMESLAFYRGQQWVRYNAQTGVLRDLRDLSNPERVWAVNNKIRPIVFHLWARAIANQSDAIYHPKTGRNTDRMATRQMRAVWEDVKQDNGWDELLNTCRLNSIVVGPCYIFTYYDTSAMVEVPIWPDRKNADPDPLDDEYEIDDQKLGKIKLGYVGPFELYPDPKARRWKDVSWCIHAKRVDLEHIKSRWPEEGQWVQPEQSGDPGEIVSVQLDNITGNQNSRMSASGRHTAILKTLWELPTIAYPKGRYIVSAGGRILEEREYLYPELARMGRLPFVPFVYRDGVETIWGDNAIYPILGPQRSRNRALSKIDERVKSGDGKLMTPRAAEISTTAFRSEKRDEVIPYQHNDPRNPGVPIPEPHYLERNPLDPTILESVSINGDDMKEITSVNDPTLGLTKGDLSGVSINALQDADQSEGTIQRDNEQRAVRMIAENVGCLARQFYIQDESRLIFIQDSAPSRKPVLPVPGGQGDGGPMNAQGGAAPGAAPVGPAGVPGGNGSGSGNAFGTAPNSAPRQDQDADADLDDDPEDSPRMQAMTFTHLPKGRWTVDSSAAAAMSPSARRNFLMQLFTAGAFRPDTLPATIVLLQEMELLGSDNVLTDDLLRALQMVERMNMDAPKPDPIALAQVQAQAESVLLHMKATIEQQTQLAKIQAETQSKIAIMQAERQAPPKVTLAGKLSPAGEVAAEEAAGLDVHNAAAHLHAAAHVGATEPVPGGVPYGLEPAPPPPMPGMGSGSTDQGAS